MRPVVLGVLLLAACGDRPPPANGGDGAGRAPLDPAPADSLALVAGTTTEVWFVAGQEAVAADGTTCYVRGLEIRDGDARRGVPLVYTLEAPTAIDDTTMRVVQYRECRPAGAYRVDYATASPRRLPEP